MKFMIGVDLEGLACVTGHAGKSLSESPAYAFACRQGTREADAAAKGFFDAGATEVVIWDNHAGGVNLDYDQIDPRCEILLGSPHRHRWPTLDASFAGVAMIGYHAMDGTPEAVLAHTYSSVSVQHMKVNGRLVGEIEIDAAVAGAHGVPLVLLSSDDKAVAATAGAMPWVEAVVTKHSLGWNAARSKHPARVVEEIRAAAARAAGRLDAMKPFAFGSPLELEIRFKRIDTADAACCHDHRWRRVDACTIARTLEAITDHF